VIRCLVADDARAFRALLREILSTAPGVEVVGEAADGREAVALVRALRPDVVTMDVRMPRLDGLEALEEIMRLAPTPVIVVSAEAGEEAQALSFRALQLGAIEVLAKPRDPGTPRFARQAEAIRQAVRAVAGLVLIGRRRSPAAPTPRPRPLLPPIPASRVRRAPHPAPGPGNPQLLAIAASTGGPAALATILPHLPAALPVPIVVVQHIAAGFEVGLARWLGSTTALDVRIAVDGALLAPGTVHIAADGHHVGVEASRIRLSSGPPRHGFRPSADHLFASVARTYGPRGAGLILTGMGSDGVEGLGELRRAGGYTAAQDAASSVVFGMPGAALASGAAAHTLDLDDIPAEILRLVCR
jgi:two-component system, chemotaxis family, protein-glutamate methylesterase/glutaminase